MLLYLSCSNFDLIRKLKIRTISQLKKTKNSQVQPMDGLGRSDPADESKDGGSQGQLTKRGKDKKGRPGEPFSKGPIRIIEYHRTLTGIAS